MNGHIHSTQAFRAGLLLFGTAGALLLAGCATPEMNPSQPRQGKAYADFYAAPLGEFYWLIDRWVDEKSGFRKFYSEFEPQRVVRLELAPGRHRFRVSFQNVATEWPVEIEIEAASAMVTPVEIRRAPSRSSYVRVVEDKVRHAGRRREVTDQPQQIYSLSAAALAPVAYQPKEQMPYAR